MRTFSDITTSIQSEVESRRLEDSYKFRNIYSILEKVNKYLEFNSLDGNSKRQQMRIEIKKELEAL